MSEWRPEGWKNPYPDINAGFPTNDFIYSEYDLFDAHEVGADAILAALKEGGVYGQYTEGVYEGPWLVGDGDEYFDISDVVSDENKKGYLVFIPDKE